MCFQLYMLMLGLMWSVLHCGCVMHYQGLLNDSLQLHPVLLLIFLHALLVWSTFTRICSGGLPLLSYIYLRNVLKEKKYFSRQFAPSLFSEL